MARFIVERVKRPMICKKCQTMYLPDKVKEKRLLRKLPYV